MDAVDFLVDRESLIGKKVVVTGCRATFAHVDFFQCRVLVGQSYFYVDGQTLDREGLRRALRQCSSFDDVASCHIAEISGTVGPVLSVTGLRDATIKWAD